MPSIKSTNFKKALVQCEPGFRSDLIKYLSASIRGYSCVFYERCSLILLTQHQVLSE